MAALPPNVHVSSHPCLRAKLSQLRSQSTMSRDTNALVSDISTLIGCEALGENLQVSAGEKDKTPLGYEYTTETISPSKLALIPILRSGLSMLPSIQSLLPYSVAVHHLGLFRDTVTLSPVEYYNNLPTTTTSSSDSKNQDLSSSGPADLAIILDPIVATGGTAAAAIATLREWGAKRVLLLSVLGTRAGLERVAAEWAEGVQVWVSAVDEEIDDKGMIVPGLGDVGDRLFLAAGK